MLAVLEIFKFDNFESKARLSFLSGFMVLIASDFYGSILRKNVVIRLFSRHIFWRKLYISLSISLSLSTSVLNDNIK